MERQPLAVTANEFLMREVFFDKPSISQVEKFCESCDNKTEDGACGLRGRFAVTKMNINVLTDQERYALREWCGYAEKDEKRGQMTAEGFKPWEEEK